ncbi:adenylate cyclase [Emydomyces testavorans]|uniref:Adenylate cyclase n=1 Tax=Emydomyces testavorans TaxID=2070801 RepID=A0AAF0DH17_9EURO|nr:adenylate cyclase [Emydomyces testavorans]
MTNRSLSGSRRPSSVFDDVPHAPYLSRSPDVSPKDTRSPFGFRNHRKALALLGAPDLPTTKMPRNNNPSSANNLPYPPALNAVPASPVSPPPTSANQGTFFHDSSEFDETSPSLRPTTAHSVVSNSPELEYADERRRPSIASIATASSGGSRSTNSTRFHKRLQGFFGEEYQDGASMERSTSNQTPSLARSRERHNSFNSANTLERRPSPNLSAPLTPLPSSEVTPWEFQNFTDIPHLGDAPVREEPTDPSSKYVAFNNAATRSKHRLHLPGHRHNRSKEEKGSANSSRPSTSRETLNPPRSLKDHPLGISSPMSMSTTTLGGRSTSPTPSAQSANLRDQGQLSPVASTPKRSLFDKIRRPKGQTSGLLKHLPASSTVFQEPLRGPKRLKAEMPLGARSRNGSVEATLPARQWEHVDYDKKKESSSKPGPSKLRHGRLPFAHDGWSSKDDHKHERETFEGERVYLDTNLGDMEGIIRQPRPGSPTDTGGIFIGTDHGAEKNHLFRTVLDTAAAGDWHAPESWAVKKPSDDVVSRLPELADDDTSMSVDEDGHPYCVRVFRIDSTFATLSASLNTTVTEILEMLGRKSFLQDDLNNYDIVMRKNDLSRRLDHGERPILMQKRLLEQAGYQPSDRIADIGREDNSYLVRFTFLPTKLGIYSSLDSELAFNENQKFSHLDLQSKNLVTIPIKLYKKAPEIISLNLSRNLALDVPKDFIQSCINLREIKFMSNEAWRLPASFSLASRLTYLDISNNCLEQLEHADLHQLHGLVSLKMANNKLSSLPSYFGDFPSLRSLNISSNNFQYFPEFLCRLDTLVDLDISFNQITELPNIGRLKTLERLWVTNNTLSGPLGGTFKSLVNLKEIDARFNNITGIENLTPLPRLETLLMGHNSVSTFYGTFVKLRTLVLDHCPVTDFHLTAPVPTLQSLNIASAKLVQFKDSLFTNMPNLIKLFLNKNHFVTLSPYIGYLRRLEHFSMAKNPLSQLPPTIGCLTELRSLNLRECNLNKLPTEIWYCLRLEILNVSSNVLDAFPKPAISPPQLPTAEGQTNGTPSAPGLSSSPSYEELGKLEGFEARRPSQASGGYLSAGSPPPDGSRKLSVTSLGGKQQSSGPRAGADGTRKDSTYSQRISSTFAGSLRQLYLTDNRLEDDIFHQLVLLPELRLLNLSYNELTELPPGVLKRLQFLSELHLSGNELSALPSDDLEESSNLKTLYLNANKFQVLPAELCKVNKLAVLDVGSNSLKYNVSNFPYDWNWNWNHNLRYLNFSGNKRFEIKPSSSYASGVGNFNGTDLTNFNSLSYIRVLGLVDVTLTIKNVPEETEDRRVRTSASASGSISYGVADTLGRNEHLSMIDMVVPRFRGSPVETIIGMFDGHTSLSGGSKIAKFLHENFPAALASELNKLRTHKDEDASDALRRAFLALNKDLATAAYKSMNDRESRHWDRAVGIGKVLNQDDIRSGAVATILYLQNMDLFVANVGNAQAVLVRSTGQYKFLTRNHDPAEASERQRIRDAGGYVSRNGKLNDHLAVSRAFGYFHMIPAVMAAPDTLKVTLTSQDEMIILASGQLWDYVTPDVVVDVARAERSDLMIASQKIRDLAMSYGATNKLMVMIAGVSDLKRRQRSKLMKSANIPVGPTTPLNEDSILLSSKRVKRPRDAPSDSRLARLDRVEAPTGELAIVFTDIKRSTSLWETYPIAMRSAIQIHNDLFRRQLSLIGGFEVKTEGDAFMVSFSTATAALLWCFTCQIQLLEAPWPTEILDAPACQERFDADGNRIYRGLSVRMGLHWGQPVCERDPVTGRMDYFGPMVNRASRISAVADGGQIFVSSDFIAEFQRTLETFADYERSSSTGSEEAWSDDILNNSIRNDLYQLSTQGFEVKDLGERKLKGLENPEFVYLMYPHSLAGRLAYQPDVAEERNELPAAGTLGRNSKLNIDADQFWRLAKVGLRLEALCSALENPNACILVEPDMNLVNALKLRGGEITDASVLNLLEHQISRIETCTNTLTIRNMMRPFKHGDTLGDHAVPMMEIIRQLQAQLAEFKALKEQISVLNPATSVSTSTSETPARRPVLLGQDRTSSTPTIVDLSGENRIEDHDAADFNSP